MSSDGIGHCLAAEAVEGVFTVQGEEQGLRVVGEATAEGMSHHLCSAGYPHAQLMGSEGGTQIWEAY